MSEQHYQDRPPPSIDPTVATLQAQQREIASLKELLIEKIGTVNTTMSGHVALDTERFTKIEERFNLIERQRIEQKADTSTSIAAALEAQKETSSGLSDKLDDVKDRVNRIESTWQGATDQRSEGRAQISSTTAIIGTILAVVGIGLALVVGHNTAASNQPAVVTVTAPSTP